VLIRGGSGELGWHCAKRDSNFARSYFLIKENNNSFNISEQSAHS